MTLASFTDVEFEVIETVLDFGIKTSETRSDLGCYDPVNDNDTANSLAFGIETSETRSDLGCYDPVNDKEKCSSQTWIQRSCN